MPTGGPEDETPPTVVATTPSDQSLNVPLDSRIRLRFSEWMSQRSVEEALFIAPYPDPYPKASWSRTTLTLDFPRGLTAERTYVFSIGTGAKDNHGVPMESSFTMAFATDGRLDRGEISGTIWYMDDFGGFGPAEEVYVAAYRLGTADIPDNLVTTPDPMTKWAEYETQTGSGGSFSFTYLAPGRYRVIAFGDRNRNTLLEQGEPVALPLADVRLYKSDAIEKLLPAVLSPLDGVPPRLVAATAPDRNHIILRFDEPVELGSLKISVTDPEPLAITILAADTSWSATVRCKTETQKPTTEYGLAIEVQDRWLNLAVLGPDSTTVRSSATVDTTGPSVAASVVRPIVYAGRPPSIALVFDDVVEGQPRVTIVDSDSTVVSTTQTWDAPNRVQLTAAVPKTPGAVVWRLDPGGIEDELGNACRDSISISFRILPSDSLGEISGQVTADGLDDTAAVVVSLPLQSGERINRSTKPSQQFEFTNIPAGRYQLTAWRDHNHDGIWSPGRLTPYLPQERMTLTDTLSVRARWTTSGIRIVFNSP